MGKFNISAKLKHRPNKDGTHPVLVTYTFNRVTKEYPTTVNVDKGSWDLARKLVMVRGEDSVLANQKIQMVQHLLHKVATALTKPDHAAVRANYENAKLRAADYVWAQQQQATLDELKENEGSLDRVSGAVATIQDVMQLQMQDLKQTIAEMDQRRATFAKSRIIQRLGDKGIFERKVGDTKEEQHFVSMQEAYLNEITDLLKPVTVTQRRALFTNLKRFSDAKNYPLKFDGMDLNFYKAYSKWVLDEEGNYDNFFGGLIKRLKTWLKWCAEKGVVVNPQSSSKSFKAVKEEKQVVYLTTEELTWLDEFRHHGQCKEIWGRVIDMGLFQASIGCRYSDMVKSSWYYENDMLKGYTIKNVSKYIIPLKTSKWLQIIKQPEYNMSFARLVRHSKTKKVAVLSEQKMNKYLKECLQAMFASHGLHIEEHEKIAVRRTRHGIPEFPKSFKWELITTHSMRRSFVSRMVRLGYTAETVGKMIGTKDMRELQKYFELDEDHIRAATDRINP